MFRIDEDVWSVWRRLGDVGDDPGRATLSSPQSAANQFFFANLFAGERQFAILEPGKFAFGDQRLDSFVELGTGAVLDIEPTRESSRFHRIGIAFFEKRNNLILKWIHKGDCIRPFSGRELALDEESQSPGLPQGQRALWGK